jgi:transcriptional regulator of heat shock response
MRERTKDILEAGVQYFIKTGFPITSERLYEEYDFGIKPAMIRCELNELDEAGYLEQGHPSGGRRPTHKGYKFYVDNLLSQKEEKKLDLSKQPLGDLIDDLLRGNTRSFVEQISDSMNMLSVGYGPANDEFYNSGLHDLFNRLEMSAKEDFLKVVEDFEFITKRIEEDREWWERAETWPQIFIGHSPVTKSKHISVIAERLELPQGDFLFFLVGPNRMDYERSIHMIRLLERSLDEKI